MIHCKLTMPIVIAFFSSYSLLNLDLIFRSKTHPLAILVQDCHQTVTVIASPLHEKHRKLITECISVPYHYKTPELSDQAVQELEEELAEEASGENQTRDDNFERSCEETADELNLAISKTEKTVKNLDDLVTKAGAVNEDDEMDSLFDSDDENNSLENSTQPEEEPTSMVRSESQLSDVQREKRIDDLEEVQSLSESLKTQLTEVNKKIHETMHTVNTLFMLAYEDLNCTEGCDIIHSATQDHVFGGLGEDLQFLFR